jgi:hypothetical protein
MAIARKRAVAYDSTIVGLVAVQEEPVADIVMATS